MLELRLIALALSAAGILGGYLWIKHQGKAECEQAQQAAVLKATEAAREREAQWQQDAKVIDEVRADENRKADAALAAANQRLRDEHRAIARLPAAASESCAGASPASLSTADATVALGIAAACDKLRADYAAARAWIEAVTR
jgi:hypothetical protein